MHQPVPPASLTEFAAALLQGTLTLALAALAAWLHRTYRRPYLAWWAGAWALFALRVAVLTVFLATGDWDWLYWHQVLTGWTALALLGASLVFAGRPVWRPWYFALALFPPIWSYIAIYRLDRFAIAAGPAVAFLSLATLWSGWSFAQYHRRVGSSGAALLAAAFVLWGLHHLDYPFLRARGALAPWGYYLDIIFELAVGVGLLLLVADDLRRGLGALAALSGDLQRSGREEEVLAALLERPLTLPAVRGSALALGPVDGLAVVRGAGACAGWTATPAAIGALVGAAERTERPQVAVDLDGFAWVAALPIVRGEVSAGALVLVGDARDPFTALDERFLVALGRQVGAALENADLYRRLEARTVELARLSARMVEEHEEERRRLSRELHDETAQVFTAVKMELGMLRPAVAAGEQSRLDRALGLVDDGIMSIRAAVRRLRPSLLDDLGLLPALRSLVTEFTERSGLRVGLALPSALPPLSKDAELALFRALQEALANVLRHSGAGAVDVQMDVHPGGVRLSVADDGCGPPAIAAERLEAEGHMGLAGMRERIGALGGTVRFGARQGGGAALDIELPAGVAP